MTLQIGEIVKDRYQILQILATGGMGIVYRAKDKSLGVEVAIKESLPGLISLENLRKNASLLAGLHHPAIPRITDTIELPDGAHALVMDFIPGEDLKNRVEKNGPLKAGEAIEIISAVGSALQYLHKQVPPIIHQDVKPGNVRITPGGNVMLVDFDLATTLQVNQTRPITNEQGLTPGFAAPEQYNQMAGTYSDQYGLAATLFYVLTGTLLPDGISRASGNGQLPEHAAARIPLDVLTCLQKALQINPSDRYPDIQSFLDSLSSIVKTQPEISSITTRNQRFTKKRVNKNLIIAIPAIVIGLTVVGIVGSLIVNKPMANLTSQVNTTALSPEMTQTETGKPQAATRQEPDKPAVLIPTEASTPMKEVKATPLGGGTGIFAYVSENSGIPQIYLASTASQQMDQLTNVPEGACQPDWSPDGKKIVFVSPCLLKSQLTGKQEPYSNSGLFIFTIENKQIIPIPSQPGGDFDPAWSPDGKQIAFTSIQNQFPQIFMYDLNLDTSSQLTKTSGANRQPAWSPDGNELAFSSNRTGTLQIWQMAKDGSDLKVISVQNNGAAFTADWAPDGKSIVYSQTNSLQLVRKIVGITNASEKVLNTRLTYASNPDISPDGSWVLFDSNLGGNYQVYRISIEGSGVEALTSPDEKSYQPVWKPVGVN